MVARFEYVLGATCAVLWGFAIVAQTPLLPVAGLLDLGLYPLYSLASALGWVLGNVYIARKRRLRGGGRRRLALYTLGPLAVIVLLRALAPVAAQEAAPAVPVYGFIVYWIFFLVPVTLRRN